MTHKMKIVRVPANYTNLITYPDLHIPKQDNHACYLVGAYGKEHKADVIVLHGDVLDNTPFSRFGHKTADEAIQKVFDMATEFFKVLRQKFPKALIYWTEGNHDLWFAKYIQGNARVLQNDPYFSLQGRLRLDEFKITYLPENTCLKFGTLYLHHGHLLFRGAYSGINPAKMALESVGENIAVAHVHRLSMFNKKGLNGKQKTGYSSGCLSVLSPNYSPFANYANGFIHARRSAKNTIVRNLAIEKEVLF